MQLNPDDGGIAPSQPEQPCCGGFISSILLWYSRFDNMSERFFFIQDYPYSQV
ncbi:MAG: hypothetical protein LC541_12935 [Candidatus Thiodiazotropha sp.]|nr:hypothetical protein [Candidatus Thiodiazotropha sp.]MCU7802955.1 hypothetical protein [Candidatus Thiodiazotropha sp. (ex Lucinoma borealis)]MCM8884176.1 hypothetical protein [Candidatus Thiodiazotropha sp.]MCM8919785.1 hypothetical protein [Candidatus Thiodiazotropha sp.]MCU7855618.1 hypothetical protein [Candidatus Thiodiazotropha sp. (ex Lucinoma borealis)]